MIRVPIIRKLLLAAGISMLFGITQFAAPAPTPSSPQQTAPDNTRMNKGDAQNDSVTADQQKMNSSDLALTRKIRAEIMKDKSLSMYAHNIKIVTRDGKVTLKGPVRTEDEKTSIESKATAVAGESNVTSQIEVAPPKS